MTMIQIMDSLYKGEGWGGVVQGMEQKLYKLTFT